MNKSPKKQRAEERASAIAKEKRAAVLKKAIVDAGLVRLVRERYDGTQGNAPEYDRLVEAGKQEEAEWHAHDYAIENVWNTLAEKGIDMEGVDEIMLGSVYASIS
jgi:hypothetical protein